MTRPALLPVMCAAVLVLAAAGPVAAQQPTGAWKAVGFIDVDGGVQAATSNFTSAVTFNVYGEDGTLAADYKFAAMPVVSGRIGFRIGGNLALGLGLSRYSGDSEASVSAEVPHPFYVNQPRSVSGTATSLAREETLAALELSWRLKLGRITDVMLFVGPAYFSTYQDMVTQPRYTESYPYDAATFAGADTTRVHKNGVGATGGIDVSFMFNPHLGLGFAGRYSYGTATFSAAAGSSTSVRLGGAQGTIGVRIRY